MILATALVLIVVFAVAFRISGIYPITLDAVNTARQSTSVMMDRLIDDEEKERRIRKAALHLLKRFAQITLTGIVICMPPAAILLVLDTAKMVQYQEVLDFLLHWETMLAATLIIVVMGRLKR